MDDRIENPMILHDVENKHEDKYDSLIAANLAYEEYVNKERKMNDIKKELLQLGFNVDSRGIIYWIDAINYVKEHPNWWDMMDIYDFLAQKYDISIAMAERNLRTAIMPAKKNIQEKYGYSRRIKNVTFLNLIKLELL